MVVLRARHVLVQPPMSASRVVPSLALAFLMAASILAIPVNAHPVASSQQSATSALFGEDAPFSGWQVRTELNHFYLHSDATATTTPAGKDVPVSKGTPTGAAIDLVRPTVDLTSFPVLGDAPRTQADAFASPDPNDHTVLIALPHQLDDIIGVDNPAGVTATFIMPDAALPVDDVRTYFAKFSVWAACDAQSVNAGDVLGPAVNRAFGPSIHAVLREESKVGSTWATVHTLAKVDMIPQEDGFVGAPVANPGDIQKYYAETPILSENTQADQASNPSVGDGPLFKPDVNRLAVDFDLHALDNPGYNPAGSCYIHYDSSAFPSQVDVTSDSARLSLFARSDDETPVTGFPSGAATDQAGRKIIVETLQASAWGNSASQLLETRTNLRLYDARAGTYLYYVENADNRASPEQDIHTIALDGRSDTALSGSLVRRTFTFHYPATVTDALVEPQLYSIPNGWQAAAQQFRIGGRGITLELANGENATHDVNPRQSTQFLFEVANIGTQEDVVSVAAADPGNGWTATVLGGGQVFLKPGGKEVVAVQVTPPPSAVAGTTRGASIRATSSFADVPDPGARAVAVHIVDQVVRKVGLASAVSEFHVRPGATKALQVTLANLGTSPDSFVIIPSVPSNVVGWTIRSQPSSMQLPAGGRGQVNVQVTAPAESAPTPFTLGLSAVEVGNSSIAKRIDVTVRQTALEGLLATVMNGDAPRELREDGTFCQATGAAGFVENNARHDGACLASSGVPVIGGATDGQQIDDNDLDRSALFRISVQNLGDFADSYKVTAVWDTSTTGTWDHDDCDGDPTNTNHNAPDGIPDGWRYNWADKVGKPLPTARQLGDGQYDIDSPGFSGVYTLNSTDHPLTVPARTTTYQYLEIGSQLVTGGNCSENDYYPSSTQSPVATLVVTITSLQDASRTQTFKATVKEDAHGTYRSLNVYDGGKHTKLVETDLGQADVAPVRVSLNGAAPGVGGFHMRAVNTGNEHDSVTLRATGSSKWLHVIDVTNAVPTKGFSCDAPRDSDGSVTCRGLGAYDEVLFDVLVSPTGGASHERVDIGEIDAITVTATSGDDTSESAVARLTARGAGTFAFGARALGNATRPAAIGSTVSLPCLIENLGTEADAYQTSLVVSDAKWSPVLSTGASTFVPGSHEAAQFLTVTVPTDAVAGSQPKQFRVFVQSVATHSVQSFDVFVRPIAPGRLAMSVAGGSDVLIPTRNVPTTVTVDLLLASGSNSPIKVVPDSLGLPGTWHVTPSLQTVDLTASASVANGRPTGKATFQVTAPADALGTSRAILRFTGSDASGVDTALVSYAEAAMDLASTFGLDLNATAGSPLNQTIAPGGDAQYNLTVHNLGLGDDTVRFTHTQLPDGWTMIANPASLTLGPLEAQNVTVRLSAPTSAQPKDVASVLVFASSVGDPTVLDSLTVRAQVGYNELKAAFLGSEPYGGPQDTLVYAFNVTNTGTLPDLVKPAVTLDTPGLGKQVTNSGNATSFVLLPGASHKVVLQQQLGDKVPSNSSIQDTLTFTSMFDERTPPASASVTVLGHVLPYVARDVNGDGLPDYAVDRNRDGSDGYEQFQASRSPGGRPVGVPDLGRFLRDDARDALSRDVTLANGTVVRVLAYRLDGDGDGKLDHFLDLDGDGQPDVYWDPDANRASSIDFRKDVNGDQVPELFVDTDGDGRIDAVFDLTRSDCAGADPDHLATCGFSNVIQTDVDGDGQLDYVVDKDHDGIVDQDETVLYTRTGKLLIVQKVDVDGDGKPDQVFDTDGDGNPDYFIPAGSTQAVPIVMRDVNGDGVQDWTYDGNNDGRYESYYDPATGQAHVIDAAGHLADAVRHYWYIGALFAVVVVLFVALVMVTRK